MFEELTSTQEKLLRDILEHRSKNGEADMSYWETRFREVEGDVTEDTLLRETLGELQKAGMINIEWADGIAYYIMLKPAGIEYFENKKNVEKSKHKAELKQFGRDTVIGVFGNFVSLLVSYIQNIKKP